jgi:diketogulonate reductase-like aldo/keto reductase
LTPSFIYGTAWKKDATAGLVRTAVTAGFTAIDTANQPKHYQEPLVGEALESLASSGAVPRSSLWLQTKFTPLGGQDRHVPYDPDADVETQVRQSFESSLAHLKTDYVDSYLLHGPYSSHGLLDEDWRVWKTIEELHDSGRARAIGISNVNAGQLALLVEHARIAPMVVQNRCFAVTGWDRAVRRFCGDRGIIYQGFSLLTANPAVLRLPEVLSIARRTSVNPQQVIFSFSMQAGMVPLTGTTSEQHMKEDLAAHGIVLTPDEVSFIESIAD